MIETGVRQRLCGNILLQKSIMIPVVFVILAIYTPRSTRVVGQLTHYRWPSWLITAHESLTSATGPADPRVAEFLCGINHGIKYFYAHIDEGIDYIAENLGYTSQDARNWLETVKHVTDASKVDRCVIADTIGILRKAGVVKGDPSIDQLVVKEAL